MEDLANKIDGQLQTPETTNQTIQNEASKIASEETENSSLFDNNFTPQDARETLEEQSEVKEAPIIKEASTSGKKITSPIFWLVGVLGVLAIIVIIIWLAAR